ncbi:MAG: glycosyltransferase family 2 protein [Caldimicrobium sp.]|nr:glycosyltransferase family 2 protein [Caldimicrobium sp.]MDW8181989.1 glycosyltransferase family 2 protein [Caldimicrobium sp.]
MSLKLISLVIPMHNEEGNVEFVYQETKDVLEEIQREKGYDFELIFVNDGSTDRTLEILRKIKERDERVRVLNMDRNRGEAAGITAGFFYARGQYIFTMDGDGQNDPHYIKDLLEKLESGFKVATGYRVKRKEPLFTRKIPSFVANRIISLVTGLKVRDNGCSLKGYISEIPKKRQIPHGFHRFLPAFFDVKNCEVVEVPIVDRKRHWGRSHYGLKRTFEVLRELMTFPFLKRAQFFEKFFKFWGVLHLGFAIITGFWFATDPTLVKVLLIGAALLGAFVSLIIHQNLQRFNLSQRDGVFRVEEL